MAQKKEKAKRANNEGSIYQNKNGLWIAQTTVGYDETGKQIRKAVSGKTRSEALAKLAPYIPKNGARKQVIREEMSLERHMHFWLMKYKKRTIAPRTFEKYLMNGRRYIYPNLGHYLPQNVTTNHLQDFLGGMLDDGFALDTVNHIKHQLGQYFDYCIDEDIIEKNPIHKVKLYKRERKTNEQAEEQEYKAIPEELREKFLTAIITSTLFKPLCLTGMFAGLRIGEIIALKWKDFNPKEKTLSVLRTQTAEPIFDEHGNILERKYVIGKTKTAGSVRVLPIPNMLVNAFNDWKKFRTMQELLTKAPLSKPDDFIFGTNEGKMRSYHGISHMFKRFLKKHGLDKQGIHFYSLRHTFSNTLFEARENPKVIQTLMGHKKVETTMIYNTATTNKYLKQAVGVFDERYAEQPQPPIKETPKEEVAEIDDDTVSRVAKFMEEFGVSSFEELLEVFQPDTRTKKKSDIEM